MEMEDQMSRRYILSFGDVTKQHINLVGGKGANLGEMTRSGLPVPKGFCIHVEAYKDFLKETEVQSTIKEILDKIEWENRDDVQQKSRRIQELFVNQNIPTALEQEILEAYHNLSDNHVEECQVAVRSSATAEDLPEASFAGQQETFLNTLGDRAVIENVKKCWASLWSARAMVYRQNNHFDHSSVYLAVVVQKMVESELSGVAFTVNPLTENKNEFMINAAYGLGELIVSGTVTPDSFILNKKNGAVIHKQLGTKDKQLTSDSQGNTVVLEVPKNKQNDYSLTAPHLLQLHALATRVEAHYQIPQDIEWSFAQGKLYLLQTRPITTIGKSSRGMDILDIDFKKLSKFQKWMLDDLIEHYPQAPLPLDYAVVCMSYQSILDCAENLGIKSSRADEIMKFEQNGKIRLQAPKVKLSFRIMRMPFTLFKAAKVSIEDWAQLKKKVEAIVRKIESVNVNKLSNKQLLQEWAEVFRLAKVVTDLRFFYIVVATMIPFSVLSFLTKKRNSCSPMITPIELITTGLDYQTVKIDRELHRLALFASQHNELTEMILHSKGENLTRFQENLLQLPIGKEFSYKLQSFLDKYGYRTEKMYQPFTSKAWFENSHEFLDILKAVIQDPHLSERAATEIQGKNELAIQVAEFEKKFKGPIRKLFRWSLKRLREFHILREETVFYLEMLFTVGRKLASEFGNRFVQAGSLNSADQIVYLQKNEIEELLTSKTSVNIHQLVNERMKNTSTNQQLWKQCLLKLSEQNCNGESIDGIIGSPGIVEGPVRIVLSVHDFHKLEKGDILVCPYTDPTWTPLFGVAAAVVADTGGQLSHAAIVAREYGIPAILGTKIATTIFHDNDQIVVDGTSGKVYKRA
jgi:rifampicin phosphotransferase